MKKLLLKVIGFLLLTVCCLVGVFVYFLFSPVVNADKGVVYYLKPGTSKIAMLSELTEQGVIPHPWLFSLYICTQVNGHLKTGEYLFPKGATPVSIWYQVTNGKGFVQHPFTIVPGWTFAELRKHLSEAQGLKHATEKLDDKAIMALLGQNNLSPEGEFFPETYYYTRGMSDVSILKRAFQLMQVKLNAAWLERASNLPYKNEYEALIAASLIEKEAYLDKERPMIAGVLINRLNKDMLLQIDPTVIYGMGNRYNGKIHKEDLLEDTAYNTYVHKGLPPTPIAIPSLASLQAAVHPDKSDYYYFVAKGDGSHLFSETLVEHNEAVSTTIKSQNHEPTKQGETYFNEEKVKGYLPPFSISFHNTPPPFVYAYGPETLIRL